MDHLEEKLGMGTTCRPWKFTSMEEMFAPFLNSSRSGNETRMVEKGLVGLF
jgi:hypothetical protein